jgi:hypothetical protein
VRVEFGLGRSCRTCPNVLVRPDSHMYAHVVHDRGLSQFGKRFDVRPVQVVEYHVGKVTVRSLKGLVWLESGWYQSELVPARQLRHSRS